MACLEVGHNDESKWKKTLADKDLVSDDEKGLVKHMQR